MEQTNFSIRKYFEELRAFTAFRDGLIKIGLEDQETICKQVEAQEKKFRENINMLQDIIAGLSESQQSEKPDFREIVIAIDTLQRVVGMLSVTGDTIARDKAMYKMLKYIEQL